MLIINLLIMCLSPQKDLSYWEYRVKRNWERDETEKTICRNKKANHLSIHRGLEREGDCSWGEKAKAFDVGRTECTAAWCQNWRWWTQSMMDSIYFLFTFLFSFYFISYFELRVGVSMTSHMTVTSHIHMIMYHKKT